MANQYKNPNYQAEYRANNKEALKISRKKYYEKNKIKFKDRARKQYHEDDMVKARKKSYYQVNKAEILKKAKLKYQKMKAEQENKENIEPAGPPVGDQLPPV